MTETKFLGFVLSTEGMKMDPAKVRTILEWGPLKNVKGVRSFLGLVNYYRRFIRDHGKIRNHCHDSQGKASLSPLGRRNKRLLKTQKPPWPKNRC